MENKQKILIIDDNTDNLKVAANILKNDITTIWVTTGGKSGIEIAETRKPDIILLDIHMPEMDGIEVCKILKSNIATKDITVIFMTAKTDDESIKEAFEAGGVDYITKPVRKHELMSRVFTHLKLVGSIKELEETIKVKDKFFSIIAHDLSTPISTIALLFEELSDGVEGMEKQEIKEIIKGTTEWTKRTYSLLQNLLEWSKAQTGAIKFEPKMYKLKKMVLENIALYDKSILEKNIKTKVNISDAFEINADLNMLKTIIRNLLYNAIKFSNNEGEIEFGILEQDEKAIFYIKDNGIGMSEKIKNNLFKIEEKTIGIGTKGEKGSGLGLILCGEFIEKHGWTIEIVSEKGKGTEFKIIMNKDRRN